MPERFVGNIIYGRTGKLSQYTTINKELAEGFMNVANMRRNIYVRDSERRPDSKTVLVGSDTLAGVAADPIRELGERLSGFFNPEPFYETTCHKDSVHILVHELLIDDRIRGEYRDAADYNTRFLAMLNAGIRSGIVGALWHDKFRNPVRRVPYIEILEGSVIWPAGEYISITHDDGRKVLSIGPKEDVVASKDINILLAPIFPKPVEWVRGMAYLLRHKDNFIVARPQVKS